MQISLHIQVALIFLTPSLMYREDVASSLNVMSLLNDPVSSNLPWSLVQPITSCLASSILSLCPLVRMCAVALRCATQPPFQN